MTEVYSWYEQIRSVKMYFWALVGLHQHLNGPIHGSFTVVFYLRIEWWIIVVLLLQLHSSMLISGLCKRKYMALTVDQVQAPSRFLYNAYKLTYWLFQCDLNIDHWLNCLRSSRWLKILINHGIAWMLASSQTWWPFNLSNCFGALFLSRTCWQKSI